MGLLEQEKSGDGNDLRLALQKVNQEHRRNAEKSQQAPWIGENHSSAQEVPESEGARPAEKLAKG